MATLRYRFERRSLTPSAGKARTGPAAPAPGGRDTSHNLRPTPAPRPGRRPGSPGRASVAAAATRTRADRTARTRPGPRGSTRRHRGARCETTRAPGRTAAPGNLRRRRAPSGSTITGRAQVKVNGRSTGRLSEQENRSPRRPADLVEDLMNLGRDRPCRTSDAPEQDLAEQPPGRQASRHGGVSRERDGIPGECRPAATAKTPARRRAVGNLAARDARRADATRRGRLERDRACAGARSTPGGAAGARTARVVARSRAALPAGAARTKPADHLGAMGRVPSHGTANAPSSVRTTTRARRTGWRQSRAARLPRASTINPPTAAWASQRQAKTYPSISLALRLFGCSVTPFVSGPRRSFAPGPAAPPRLRPSPGAG